MRVLVLGTFAVVLVATPAFAQRNTPCSQSAGGVVACTADGRFQCRDGRVSESKQKCTAASARRYGRGSGSF